MTLRFGFFLLMALPLAAQLELPEYLFPEDETEAEIKREAPRHQEREKTEKSQEEEIRQDAELKAVLQKLKNNPAPLNLGGIRLRIGAIVQPDESVRIQQLRSGPPTVNAEIRLTKGRTVKGRINNQILMVRASFGPTPLRLGEIRSLTREADGSFRFEMADGDLLLGDWQRDTLTLNMPDGGTRVVPLADIESLSLP